MRQVNANGMWVAASGTDLTMAYLLEITGGVAHSCTCPAGQYGDPVCKHRAQWYFNAGLLSRTMTPRSRTHRRSGPERLSGLQRVRRPLQPRAGTARAAVPDVPRVRWHWDYHRAGPTAGSVARERGNLMSNEHSSARRGTFSAAHASIQISHTDGSFFEMSVNLKPALGPHDVEDALEECSTLARSLPASSISCRTRAPRSQDDTPSHADQVSLSDAEMERSSRLLREALGDETDPGA